MLRRLQSSSPILGVYVRPRSIYPCGGGKVSGSSTLMVVLALHDLGGKFIAAIFPNTALDNTKLGNLIPSAPPWTIICPTKLGVPYFIVRTPRFVLGATATSICIIAYPDMKHLTLHFDFPWENIVPNRFLYKRSIVHTLKVQSKQNSSLFLPSFVSIYILHIPLTSEHSPEPTVDRPLSIMEELTNNLSANLNLTEIETKIHSFAEPSELPEDENREEPSAFLAVKLLTTRHFNSEAFKKRLKEMWPERFSINVLEKEPNFFTVEFGCFGDRRRVLIGQPWHFDFKLIVMSPLEAGSVVTAEMLTSTPFWIQVSGIPFLKRSRALAIKLGEVLGRFIEVDTASLKETWGPYLRVRIEIDVTQPLPAKCDSSSAPPPLQYDHTLGAKIRITSNPFYIASTRTRLRPHVTQPVSLAPPNMRTPSNHIISEPSFNDPSSEYGVQYLHQPRTTPVGCYMTQVPQQNTFIRDIHGSNIAPPFSAWTTSSNIVNLDSPTQSRRSVPPLAYPMLHDQNINPNNSMSVPEQVAPSSPIVAAPTITNANFSDATGHTVPVSQAFATIMADLNANQPLTFAVGSSSSPATASTSGRRYKPKRPPSINEIEFRKMLKRTRDLARSLDEGYIDEAGAAQRTRQEP
uniref:DUF4283 domain-containing protein n=1 Tax=Cannabis sativa TaxID=3483 RepID=A0A803NNI9_CANSA